MKKIYLLLVLLMALVVSNAQTDTVFYEGFDNGVIPAGWNNLDQDGDDNEWEIITPNMDDDYYTHSGNGMAASYSYNNGEVLYPDNWLVTPGITLTDDCALTFWRRTYNQHYPADHYGVYISTTSPTDISSFTLLYEETPTSSNYLWEERTILLTEYANQTVYIAFRHFDCSDEYILFLDDIWVGQLTYIDVSPSDLSLYASVNGEAIASTSVTTFNLNEGVTATTSSPFSVSSDSVNFGNTAELPSSGGTLYVRYSPVEVGTQTGVVILTGGGVSNTLTVTGQGVVPVSLPFTCDFENDSINQFWHFANDDVNQWFIGTAVSNGGSHGLYISNDSGTTHAYTETVSNVSWAYIDVDLGQYSDYMLSFDFLGDGGYYYDRMYVVIAPPGSVSPGSMDTPAGAGFIGSFGDYSNWNRHNITRPSAYGGIKRIFFLWTNYDYGYGANPPAAIDNFSIIGYTCGYPTNLDVNNITATTADVSFAPRNSDDQAWEYAITDGSQSPDDVPHVLINTPAFHLTGLTPNTSYYYVYVRTVCGDGEYSRWSNYYYFSTPETCPTPFNLSFPNITGTTAKVTWSPNYAAAGNETYHVECIAEDGTAQTIITTNFECVFTGLEPLTPYTVMLYMDCGEGDHSDTLWATLTTNCLSGGNLRIGQGTTSSTNLPFYYYRNNYSQQIYLASELNGPHEIQSIAFDWFSLYGYNYSPYTRNFKIYLMHTDSATNANWLDATTATLVYSNDSVPLAQGWNTFTFNAPFLYDGIRNLAVIVVDSIDYSTPLNYSTWRCHSAPGLSCYAQGYDPYDIANMGSVMVNPTNERCDVIFGTPCDTTVTCVAPIVRIDAVTGNSITVSWVPGYQETAWEVQYKADSDSLWITAASNVTTTSFTLDSLQIFTTYAVRVGTICDNDRVWCAPLNALTGSYNMLHQGSDTLTTCDMLIYDEGGAYGEYTSLSSSILVLYPETDNAVVTLSGTVKVENDFDYLYIYDGAGVSEETLIYAFTGTQTIPTIVSSTGPLTIHFVSDQLVSDDGFELHVGCTTCLKPSNVQVSGIGSHSAVVSWTGNSDNYEFWYANIEDSVSTTLSVEGATSVTLNGLDASSHYIFKVRSDCGDGEYSQQYYGEFLTLEEGQIAQPEVVTGAVSDLSQTTATLNAIIANPDSIDITEKGFEWKALQDSIYTRLLVTEIGNIFSHTLSNLTAGTTYSYKAYISFADTIVYGEEVSFTTDAPDPCDVPVGLTVTSVENHAMTITWDENSAVNSWNIRYRTMDGEWDSLNSSTNSAILSDLNGLTTYEIQVQADCGEDNVSGWCESITETTTNVGIDSWLMNSVKLYPNPAKEVVNVQFTIDNVQFKVTGIDVFDVYGKLISTVDMDENPTRINVSGLANGMYFVRVATDQGMVTKSFVKR